MKRPTAASLKKVTPENLARLGVDRLAEILVSVADSRPELKRRLRMELAAEQGAEHLTVEIDKRLARLSTTRSKVSWRQRPAFLRDLEALRTLIGERLAEDDATAALERQLQFVNLAPRVAARVRDKDGKLAALFARAVEGVPARLAAIDADAAAARLVDAVAAQPTLWADALPKVLEGASADLARAALRRLGERSDLTGPWVEVVRGLADAAGDADLYRSTFTERAQRDASVAADIAVRLLASDRVDEAGAALDAVPAKARADDAWEAAHIDWLERSGRGAEAQAARWSAFERTLDAEHARAFTRRLSGFDDVEAEERAFAHAARHRDFQRGLAFLMAWPALLEASQMIEARAVEAQVDPELAEAWGAKLLARYPKAAHLLLRKAAAAAFQRRDFATCDRLTAEADAIEL